MCTREAAAAEEAAGTVQAAGGCGYSEEEQRHDEGLCETGRLVRWRPFWMDFEESYIRLLPPDLFRKLYAIVSVEESHSDAHHYLGILHVVKSVK
jgi:hypothetical protein